MKTISVRMNVPDGAEFFRVDNENHTVQFYKYQQEKWYVFDTGSWEWYIDTRPQTEPLWTIA